MRWRVLCCLLLAAAGASVADRGVRYAWAASAANVCRVEWQVVLSEAWGFQANWWEFACDEISYYQVRRGYCDYVAATGATFCYSLPGGAPLGADWWPSGWLGADHPVSIGTCACWPGGCYGTCTAEVVDGAWVAGVSTCNEGLTGCDCGGLPSGPVPIDGSYAEWNCGDDPPGYPPEACMGSCTYVAEANGSWTLITSDCIGEFGGVVAGCDCPTHPTGPGPCWEEGATITVSCGQSEGVPCDQACSGVCEYVSTSDGAGGYVWSFSTSNCNTEAGSCDCPASPGGSCPTGTSQNMAIACGSPGGPCSPSTCTGQCKYRAKALEVSGEGEAQTVGKYVWELYESDCADVTNCDCPVDPGGDCPRDQADTREVNCGSVHSSCKPNNCVARGGDEDNDGCCADEDLDDKNPGICKTACEGTYRVCEREVPCEEGECPDGVEVKVYPCDPKVGSEESRASCRCRDEPNKDTDRDGCCDNVDKWPTDPARGCECCDWEQAWYDAGGQAVRTEWDRIFGADGLGPFGHWVEKYGEEIPGSASPHGYRMKSSWLGEPDPISVVIPMVSLSAGLVSGTAMCTIPTTVAGFETLLELDSGSLSDVDSYRGWARSAGVFAVWCWMFAVVFREMRV